MLERLPCCVLRWQATPFDKHVPHVSPKLCTKGALRSWQQPAIRCRRQRSRSRWGITFVGLQQPHMEDIMQTGALRKLEAVRHLADALQHLEQTGVARAKLPFGAGLEGLGSAVEQAQPYPIPDGKLPVAVGRVVVFLG